ncbi:FAD-binding oxidoreductase [Streptomyces sp. NPDC047072]|uniref:FAD-binding oxidoreductase n=1 Tax=Streptomyces sp. NPDC047072 TaxID=3154809 RepID=UPI00340B1DF2
MATSTAIVRTDPDVIALAEAVQGQVFLVDDPGYAEACATYNLLTPLSPVLAVAASGPADVQAAVRFATGRGLGVAVRNGGHQVVRPTEDTVLVNLSAMSGVTVDPTARTVRIEGGALWGDVIEAAAKHDLAPLNGSSPTVGAIGYCLGGGHGPVLSRKYGYAAEHVTSMDVVLASGVTQRVTAASDPRLFFALRGGKGNFAVVTAVEMALFPVARFYGGGLWFPGEQLADVLRTWQPWCEQLPDEFSTSVAIQRLPDDEMLPPPLRGAFVVHVRLAHLGDAAEGEAMLAPLRALGPTVLDTVADTPYREVAAVHSDPPLPLPYVDRSSGLRELSAEAIDRLVELTGPGSDCPLVSVEIRRLGGAMDREPRIPDAVPSRGLPYQLFAFGVGGPDQADELRASLAGLIDGMSPWAHKATMLNFLSPDEATVPEEVLGVYGVELYARLAALKSAYDPLNVFRANYNIVPLVA